MQQIADWLEKLGMSEYAERFAENGIDVAVLRHLTDQDLKDTRRFARASAEEAGARLPSRGRTAAVAPALAPESSAPSAECAPLCRGRS